MHTQDASAFAYHRRHVLERTDPENKTPEQKTRGRVDRAQLYLFLSEINRRRIQGEVLVSRMSPAHFWCQTGFVIRDNVVYGKYGDSPYQPIGWDSGEEFYPLDVAKLLWKHEFAWVTPTANPAETPWEIEIEEVAIEDEDGEALSDRERTVFERLIKDLKEELDWTPPKGWKRDPSFTPKHAKPLHELNEIIDLTTKWTEEHQEEFIAAAKAKAPMVPRSREITTEDGETVIPNPYITAYESTVWAGDNERPDFETWLVSRIAEDIATEASARYVKELRAKTTEWTPEELDALARKDEHDFRVRETVKLCCVASPRFDRKVQSIITEHPEVGKDLEGIDIQGFAAQCVDWMRMRLDEDTAGRIVRGTTATPRIGEADIEKAEAAVARDLMPEVRETLADIKAAGGIESLEEGDEVLHAAHAVIAQLRAAVPACREVLEDDIFVSDALERLWKLGEEKGWNTPDRGPAVERAVTRALKTLGILASPEPETDGQIWRMPHTSVALSEMPSIGEVESIVVNNVTRGLVEHCGLDGVAGRCKACYVTTTPSTGPDNPKGVSLEFRVEATVWRRPDEQ